jgi:DNA-binding MarR family transcriptional regulator
MPTISPPQTSLHRQAIDLLAALTEFSRIYQYRDRDQICCDDVSVTQCHALDVLVKRGRCTLRELARELVIDKSTASRVVASLVRKGFVARVRHPMDGRAVQLAATVSGRHLHARIHARLVAEQRRVLEGFPREVREAAAELIRRLTSAVRSRTRFGSARQSA